MDTSKAEQVLDQGKDNEMNEQPCKVVLLLDYTEYTYTVPE